MKISSILFICAIGLWLSGFPFLVLGHKDITDILSGLSVITVIGGFIIGMIEVRREWILHY